MKWRLRAPVNFVCAEAKTWPELRDGQCPYIPPERLSALSGGIANNWILRTYYELRRAGVEVALSSELTPLAVNVVSTPDFGRRQRLMHGFVLAVRGDFHDTPMADFVVEQNHLGTTSTGRAGMFHWPQPGLVPRDPQRGLRVDRVVFKGHDFNLAPAFRDQAFVSALDSLGIELEIDARNMATGAHMWHDYRHADVVLAVRNLTAKDALAKPASKLVNAWLAGVPAILGPEPAYREIRRSDLDYIEVKTAQEALDALARLRSTPGLYQAMVENGRKRGADFTEPATVRRWVDLLDGPVHEAYCAWQRRPASVVRLGQLMGIAMETHAKRRHRRSILTGRRILDP